MSDYSPVYEAGVEGLSWTVGTAVTGGQLVAISAAGTVSPAGAASTAVAGVASQDVAAGGRVMVWPLANLMHEVVASGSIAVGDGIVSAAGGQAATVVVGTGAAAGTLLGIASTAATNGNKVRFIGR